MNFRKPRRILISIFVMLVSHALPTFAANAPMHVPRFELPATGPRAASGKNGTPMQFAEAVAITVSPNAQGQWSAWDENNDRWRIEFFSANAKSINLHFDRFKLPQGAILRLFAPEAPGSALNLTAANNQSHGAYWSPQIGGNSLVLDLVLPRHYNRKVDLNIANVNLAW